jgi:hypothetical protein
MLRWLCRMKIIALEKKQQNEAAIDPWTVVHFSAGLAMGLMDIPLRRALAVSLTYEVVEQFMERRPIGEALFRVSRPETLPNAIVDMVTFAAGHRLGARWNETG